MAQLLVRNLEDEVKAKLRVLAAEHGRSMEEEVRAILRQAVAVERGKGGFGSRAAALFAKNGLRESETLPDLRDEVARPVPPSSGLGTEIAALFKDIGLREGEEIPEMRGEIIKPWRFDDC